MALSYLYVYCNSKNSFCKHAVFISRALQLPFQAKTSLFASAFEKMMAGLYYVTVASLKKSCFITFTHLPTNNADIIVAGPKPSIRCRNVKLMASDIATHEISYIIFIRPRLMPNDPDNRSTVPSGGFCTISAER